MNSSGATAARDRSARGALVLGKSAIAALLAPRELLEAVDRAFALQAQGAIRGPVSAGLRLDTGSFHAKGAADGERVAFKINGNFPDNGERFGLPTIQGVVVLASAETGRVLGLFDSGEITAQRTAATTAVAALRLLRPGAVRVALVGCGVVGAAHARLLSRVLELAELRLVDRDGERAVGLAIAMSEECTGVVRAVESIASAVHGADLVVTATTAREPVIAASWIALGSVVAAVGADNATKQELDPDLFRGARVVVDDLEACRAAGELFHALAAGTVDDPLAVETLANLVSRARPNPVEPNQIALFDSTGVVHTDLAAASLVYDRACASGEGRWIRLTE